MLTFLLAAVDGYETHFDRQLDKIGQRAVFLFPGASAGGRRPTRCAPGRARERGPRRLEGSKASTRAAAHVPIGARLLARRRTRQARLDVRRLRRDPRDPRLRGRRAAARHQRRSTSTTGRARRLPRRHRARRAFHRRCADAVGRTVHIDGIPVHRRRRLGAEGRADPLHRAGRRRDGHDPDHDARGGSCATTSLSQVVFEAARRARRAGARPASARGLLGFHHAFRPRIGRHGRLQRRGGRASIVAPLYLGSASSSWREPHHPLVGAVGVMNIMLVVVTERTKEIGLRKSIGGSNGAIFAQFLAETLLVCLVAGTVGALLGMGSASASWPRSSARARS